MPSKYLLAEERVVRYVSYARLRKDENGDTLDQQGRPLGVTFQAFELRAADEGNLSVTWCEFYAGSPDESLNCALAITANSMDAGGKSGFAVQSVGVIDDFLVERDRKCRFVHEETDENPAHSLIRRWPEGDAQLLDAIATGIDWQVHLKSRLVVSPTPCVVSARGTS